MDVKILGVLQDIQSIMQDYVWKSALGTQSGMESINGDQELLELQKEKEEQAKKVSEMEVMESLFTLEEMNQTLRE